MSGRRCGDLGERCKRSQRLQLDLACGPRYICCKHAGSGRATPARTCPRPPSRAIERDMRIRGHDALTSLSRYWAGELLRAGNCIDLRPNFRNSPALNAKDVDASPSRHATKRRYVAKLTIVCAGRGVPLDDKVILRDELGERVNEIGECGQKVAHHGRDAGRFSTLG